MKIIDRLFIELDRKNLRAVDLASALGINKSVISNWKTRSTNPPSELIVPICEFIGIDALYLLTGTQMQSQERISEPLAEIEQDIVDMFRQLDDAEKEDVLDYTKMKYDKAVKKGKATSLYSTYTKEPKENTELKNSSDKKDSGIA